MIKAAVVHLNSSKYLMISAPVGRFRYDAEAMRKGLKFDLFFRGSNMVLIYDLTRYQLVDMNQDSIIFIDRSNMKHRMFIPFK